MTELTAPNIVASPTRSDRRRKLLQNLLRGERPYMLYIAFVVLLVVFSLSSPWFLSVDNFLNIGRQTTLVSIIAVGMTFVIIARQIDLSVASTLALSGMAAALAMSQIYNSWIVGAVAGLGTGALVGLLNGILTTQLSIPSFLVTLGSLSMARGLAMMVTNTKPVIITNETYFAIFGEGTFLGIPVPIAWTLAAMVVGVLLLHYNVFGRRIYAVGGNPTAALYSGINTKWVTTAAFVLTGALAFERGLVGGGIVLKVAHAFEQLRVHVMAGERDQSLAGDPIVRDRMATLASEIEIGRQLMMRCAELAADGVTPPEYGAISKVFSGELMERFGEAALDILGMRAALSEQMPGAIDNGRFEQNLRHSLMWVISIATNEIQRSLIAQRALGLPR